MPEQNFVAVFPSHARAEEACSNLVAAGIPRSDIRMSEETTGDAALQERDYTQEGSFWSWLFGTPTETDRSWYQTNLRDGRTAVSVHADDSRAQTVHRILDDLDPIDIDAESVASARGTGETGLHREGEQVIPVVKEELAVGKQETERRIRIRTYTVERPVEQQVHLRDERVVVERRPREDGAIASGTEPGNRDIEIVERHETPVASKRARADEEVVVHKEASDRVETVRDKVRETKVDIGGPGAAEHADRAAAGDKPAGQIKKET